jgi:hypothetical protein
LAAAENLQRAREGGGDDKTTAENLRALFFGSVLATVGVIDGTAKEISRWSQCGRDTNISIFCLAELFLVIFPRIPRPTILFAQARNCILGTPPSVPFEKRVIRGFPAPTLQIADPRSSLFGSPKLEF